MCYEAQVSRSGFYRWAKSDCRVDDEFEVDLIKMIFESKREKAGARTIKMILLRDFGIVMNLKKIRRIKRDHGLYTKIRNLNKYASSAKVGEDHQTVPNIVNRQFEAEKPDKAYSMDITFLSYGKNQKAYLFAVKDLCTREIVHFKLSSRVNLEIVTNGLEEWLSSLPIQVRQQLIAHSDQGSHFTSKAYRQILMKLEITQSMSRKGNCLDNAPIESFFGHMKDEITLERCQSYEELELEINRYIKYYNNERPQWGLKMKTPAECRGLSL